MATGGGNKVIVWSYLSIRRKWIIYEPDVCHHIENAFLSGASSVALGQVSPLLKAYAIDFSLMTQVEISRAATQVQVQRHVASSDSPLSQGVVWEFEGDPPHTWMAYDWETMHVIENTFTQRNNYPNTAATLDLRNGQFPQPYIINLAFMTQTRVDTGKLRRIQRRPLAQTYPLDTSAVSNVLSVGSSSGGSSVQQYAGTNGSSRKRSSPYTRTQSRTINGAVVCQAHSISQPQTSSISSNIGNSQHTQLMSMSAKSTSQYINHSLSGFNGSLLPGAHLASQLNVGSQSTTWPSHNGSLQPTQSPSVTESLPAETVIQIHGLKKSKSKTEELMKYMVPIKDDLDKIDCPICCEKLSEPSDYGEGRPDAHEAIKLSKCGHQFHKLCLLQMYQSTDKNTSLQCPSCKTIYGEKTGICPPGKMSWQIQQHTHLAGYESFGTIMVSYYISSGTQGPQHPDPGKPFSARGFPRIGYIPDCDKGRKLLKLLMIAFKRHLMFTIGTSYTTGETNTVTWNEIHHKTSVNNHNQHGYPDPNYIDNCLLELRSHGVTEDCLNKHM